MQLNTFQIAENEQKLQYYSYMRQILQTKQINYWMGNPSVELMNGTIYLKQQKSLQTDEKLQHYQQYLKHYNNVQSDNLKNEQFRCKTLALVGVPNSKNPVQVCERFNAYLDGIKQVKIVKTSHFKFYAMLLLFKSEEIAKQFLIELQGDEFNSLQIQRILIRQIVAVSLCHTDAGLNQNQPIFQHRKRSNMNSQDALQKIAPQQIFSKSAKNASSSPRKKQFFKQIDSPTLSIGNLKHNELSSCVICQQQTQQTLISILCSHYFHVKCLSQWKESTCPLCRYHQHPPLIKFCEKCNQCEGLWVCLVCGIRLCCGFDHDILGNDSHIYQHFLQTQHRLSMELQSKFIFDASQPAFLHQMLYKQIIKNENSQNIECQANVNKKGKKSKLSQKISQYQQSISQQMQRQRTYFQQNINRQVKKRKQQIKKKKKQISDLQAQINLLDGQLAECDRKKQQYEISTNNFQKQLKAIGEVKKYWEKAIQKCKQQSQLNNQIQSKQLKRLQQQISLKKQQLKDYRKNKQLSAKIKENIGKDKVEASIIFGAGQKQNKKKKK